MMDLFVIFKDGMLLLDEETEITWIIHFGI